MNREEQKSTALSTEVCVKRRRQSEILCALSLAFARRREKNGEIVLDLLVGAAAAFFAMCHALFGVYPFSLALLFATSGRVLPVLAGAAVGCTFLGDAGVLYLALHMLALLFRLWASYPTARRRLPESPALFEEEPALRAVGATLLGGGMALYELILFGVRPYTLLFAAGALLLLPLSTLLFSFFTAQKRSVASLVGRETPVPSRYFGTHAPFLFSLGGVFLLFVTALSLAPYQFFGISLAGCVTTAATLFVSRRYGAARGCAAGLVIGLAGNPLYLPVYGILGLLSGLYSGLGMPLAMGAAVISGGGYAAYVGGLSGFLSVVPEMAVTSLLLWAPLRLVSSADEPIRVCTEPPRRDARENETEESLACLSGALAAVSEELKEAAKRERTPSAEEYEALCVGVKERICRRCPAEGACAEGEAVKDGLRRTVIRLSLGEGIPEGASVPCEGYGRMLEEMRREAALLGQRKRQGGVRGALSTDYALFAEMLKSFAETHREDARDTATEDALREALSGYGITADEITVVGKRQRRVSLVGLQGEEGRRVEGEWVEDACVRVCGRSVTGLRFSYENGRLCARAESRPVLASAGGVYTSAGGGECSADAAATVENGDGFVYALLSDGMGSGARAAEAASLSVSVLSSLLSAGVKRQVALAVINNVICASEEECSVALDLLSLDLYEGRASFLKSGAAASFVYRDGALFRIRSRTIPLGLLRIVDSEEASFEVREGDILVLLSDGVLGESEDGSWLKEILSMRADSQALARAVVEGAERRGVSEDDKTALVLRITAKKEK